MNVRHGHGMQLVMIQNNSSLSMFEFSNKCLEQELYSHCSVLIDSISWQLAAQRTKMNSVKKANVYKKLHAWNYVSSPLNDEPCSLSSD